MQLCAALYRGPITVCVRFYFPLVVIGVKPAHPLTDKQDMERETILAIIWTATDAHTDDRELAETTRQRLESGELEPAGNCRNVERAYWAADEKE